MERMSSGCKREIGAKVFRLVLRRRIRSESVAISLSISSISNEIGGGVLARSISSISESWKHIDVESSFVTWGTVTFAVPVVGVCALLAMHVPRFLR